MLDTNKFNVNKNEGVATVTYEDDNAFFENTDLTKATIKKVFTHAQDYIDGASSDIADFSKDLLAKDKSLTNVLTTVPYGISKRGELNVNVKRSHTYPGMNGNPDVTKSTVKITVKDPSSKLSKAKVKAMEAELTSALLG